MAQRLSDDELEAIAVFCTGCVPTLLALRLTSSRWHRAAAGGMHLVLRVACSRLNLSTSAITEIVRVSGYPQPDDHNSYDFGLVPHTVGEHTTAESMAPLERVFAVSLLQRATSAWKYDDKFYDWLYRQKSVSPHQGSREPPMMTFMDHAILTTLAREVGGAGNMQLAALRDVGHLSSLEALRAIVVDATAPLQQLVWTGLTTDFGDAVWAGLAPTLRKLSIAFEPFEGATSDEDEQVDGIAGTPLRPSLAFCYGLQSCTVLVDYDAPWVERVARFLPQLQGVTLSSRDAVREVARHCPNLERFTVQPNVDEDTKEVDEEARPSDSEDDDDDAHQANGTTSRAILSELPTALSSWPSLTAVDLLITKESSSDILFVEAPELDRVQRRLSTLHDCPKLKSLSIAHPSVTVCSAISRLPAATSGALTTLHLDYVSELTDRALVSIAQSCPGLRVLCIREAPGPGVTAQGVSALAAAPFASSLSQLTLTEFNNPIKDAGLLDLAAACGTLELLDVTMSCKLADCGRTLVGVGEHCPFLHTFVTTCPLPMKAIEPLCAVLPHLVKLGFQVDPDTSSNPPKRDWERAVARATAHRAVAVIEDYLDLEHLMTWND